MERNSFLNMPANSVQDLVAQVATHPRVALRYSKHFGRTDGQVVSFFSKNLRKERLKTDRIAQVYYYTKDGRIYSKMSRLKAGTLVFATLSGTPVLKASCGNPVLAQLPMPAQPEAVIDLPDVTSEEIAKPPVIEGSDAIIPTEPPVVTLVEAEAVTPVESVTEMAIENTSAMYEETPIAPTMVIVPAAAAGFSPWSLLPILGLGAALGMGGGGGAIPEPSTVAALSAAALVALRLRAGRRN